MYHVKRFCRNAKVTEKIKKFELEFKNQNIERIFEKEIDYEPNFDKINEPINQISTIIENFKSGGENELSCFIGENAKILQIDSSGWWYVEIYEQFGYIPGRCTNLYNVDHLNYENNFHNSRLKKRISSVKELLNSEKIYVDQLKTLINDFIIPIRKRKIMNEEEINQVFSNIESIYELNRQIYENFRERFDKCKDDNENLMIGDVIPKVSPFLKIYIEYLFKNEKVMKNIGNIFNSKLRKLANEKKQTFYTLQSLLVLPAQRITRYPLLFQSIFKYTSIDHPDYSCLEKSVEVTENISKKSNQSINI
eukprot:TRINITY_DN3507_c0_g1_i1.p1 TRINITY_DN3507_c0_g1~~TRINITY_DN3507_c0_g1_i1.p1  ORF type:complete len:308 (+),score=76.94 TRINITY_DN3507_c0_g1_i1:2-925(+)